MLELHCHGGQAVVRSVMEALRANGLFSAEPGDFSKRAFLNGKMDLTQAEAVMDLIEAEASLSARAALMQMQGKFREKVEAAEALLYDALTLLSAAIDYPEEMEEEAGTLLPNQLDEAVVLLSQLIKEGSAGRILREGFRVALMGAPNAGKSSLLNALLGFDRAIVTGKEGTTRDLLEESASLDGAPLRLIDMAGIRETADEVEQIGVALAKEALRGADLILLLLDGSMPIPENAAELFEEVKGRPVLALRTKSDLPALWGSKDCPPFLGELLSISAKTGENMEALKEGMKARMGLVGGEYVTNARHIQAMETARAALRQAIEAQDADCAATDIRDALMALGSITGRSVDDEVIGKIFERFCVGK